MSKSKNDIAWEELFDKYNIISEINKNGKFEITAKQINEVREARLMTKFDHKVNLPKIFADNKLSILPITRGNYIISKFEVYSNFENINPEVVRVQFPEYITSIDYENISSEAMAINCAYVSGIIHDFVEDDEIVPTVSGRMSSETFSFKIKDINSEEMEVRVENSQIEIDGGYEGIKTLSLIEAKNSLSDDFIIRQLYYPYRLWSNKVDKKVKPIFMVYSNGIYNLYEYEFKDKENYNSLVLVKQKNYTIENIDIEINDIIEKFNNTEIMDEPEIPFPQADSFNRVINLCELLYKNEMTKEEITVNYDFDPRQTNYYADAGRYLGLIDKKRGKDGVKFFLTLEGKNMFKLRYKERQLKYVELIFKHKAFRECFKECLASSEIPARKDVVRIMEESNLYKVRADSTYERRASTVTGWVNWIIELTKIVSE
ncbi:MAG: transcriptional regulator [Clostridium sp.]|uniref:type II restriction enzyme n=1 Tax=Clostridium sp. TaxID=1506 RepID=UPI00290FC64B|nr:transcriptional regulator [Clostridium sp.]MDU5740138.1 transcriptional regulator [Clostridium sp.]MDU5784250.1 transcriptional regulator [Clostridium sp.]